MNTAASPVVPPVSVGKTDFPLKPSPDAKGPVPLLSPSQPGLPHWRLLDGHLTPMAHPTWATC